MTQQIVRMPDNSLVVVDENLNIIHQEKDGIILSTDASGHEHGEHGHFAASDSAHAKTQAAVDYSEAPGSSHRFNSDLRPASIAAHRAKKAGKEGDHKTAMKQHGQAAKLHHRIADKISDHRAADRHREAADAHEDAAAHHEMLHDEKSGTKGEPKMDTRSYEEIREENKKTHPEWFTGPSSERAGSYND